jgi:Xaa-Pro aminopeptidase
MQKLIPGMVVTIEPGLYDKKNCGVRIEDDVLITESKALPLTTFTKELTII